MMGFRPRAAGACAGQLGLPHPPIKFGPLVASLGLQQDTLRVSLGTLETFRIADNEIEFKTLREMLRPN